MTSIDSLRQSLLEKGYNIISEGTLDKDDHTDAPEVTGVYALYWGTTLQYIGKATSVYARMLSWSNDGGIPFGSFSWFELPDDQFTEAEKVLIREYQPEYNNNLKHSDDDD
ncbi:MAG: hypothetical protein ACTSSD_19520 [Candidatus Thorarchaeota archaeon]